MIIFTYFSQYTILLVFYECVKSNQICLYMNFYRDCSSIIKIFHTLQVDSESSAFVKAIVGFRLITYTVTKNGSIDCCAMLSEATEESPLEWSVILSQFFPASHFVIPVKPVSHLIRERESISTISNHINPRNRDSFQ